VQVSTLLLDELRTTLDQDFTVSKRINLVHVYPKLYLHNDPSGTFTLTVKEGSTTLSSNTFTMAAIKSGASLNDNEFHTGFFQVTLTNPVVLNKDVTYTIEISASGYTFSESSYLGWEKEWDDYTNTFSVSITGEDQSPFAYRLWGY
jgi:hypothetical protein